MKLPSLAAAIPLTAIWHSPGVSAAADKANDLAASYLASISVQTATQPAPGSPTDRANAAEAVLSGNYTSKLHYQRRPGCPADCTSVGVDTSAWFRYGGLESLDAACNKPLLLDFALWNEIDGDSQVAISSCTADYIPGSSSESQTATCAAEVERVKRTSGIHCVSSGPSSPDRVDDVVTALENLRGFTLADMSCNATIKFAYARDLAVGVYSGSGLAGQDVLGQTLDSLIAQIRDDGSIAESVTAEMCGSPSARYCLGVAIDTRGDLGAVQRGVQGWHNGTCTSTRPQNAWQTVSYLAPAVSDAAESRSLWRRDECRTIQVERGDLCGSLATECGITLAEFTEYNPGSDFCSNLRSGQHVCCSEGTMPDFTPHPDDDGYCATHLVQRDETCSQLAAANGLTSEQIEKYNQDTWGWNGCHNMFADYKICLSPGYPPMPATVPNAVCGPQVNGTAKAPPGTDLSELNQCPLNACCNIWGQCGTTAAFCVKSESATGAPGTAAPDENGCISNCGMDIIMSDSPAETYSIAYFEAWAWERPCLRMSVNTIDTSVYTHIHYSFIELNDDFSINIDKSDDQLPLFLAMRGIKKIASIGGWGFSTNPKTYDIFRKAVATPANRDTLVTNIIDFLTEHDLDGIDWDWEYPAQPDIPGIPPGDEDEATGFFLLLDELKQRLPDGMTSSVTAPASFWYLQHMPINAISLVTDYLVFMTYDLHGQWDYKNKYATPGCPSFDQGLGNCLRSHVNLTETLNALSMVTKAGVPSSMTIVGVSSYGRSFEMTTTGCWTEQCTYTGPESGAYPGRCTTTPGYISNYEIREILRTNPTAQDLFDDASYSNIMVFNSTQWAAYMDKENKEVRQALYPQLSFLGSADWAVDLQSEQGGGASDSENNSSSGGTYYVNPDIWNAADPVVTAPPGVSLIWPPMPLATPTTIGFDPWTTSVTYSSLTTRTSTLPGGLVTAYPWYEVESWLTVFTIPPVTTTEIPVWGVTVDSSSAEPYPITLTSSVQPPLFTVTVTPVLNGTTSIIGATTTTTITHDPVVWDSTTYSPPVETRTLGGSTTVIGGKTKPPTPITVTPNPHPTKTPDPDDEDPKLNSKTPTVSPGHPPSPTAPPGCPGCGWPCLFFCNPHCPFCPPGVFGPPGGGGSDNNNDNDNDDDNDDDSDSAEYTIRYAGLIDDAFPTAFVPADVLSSLNADIMSRAREEYGISTTTTTTTKHTPTTTTTTTTTPKPDPTPVAKCAFWDTVTFYTFKIYDINNWAEKDGGKSLHEEENGCGAIAHWNWRKETDDEYAYVYFTLPFFIKAGCVERAIVSAGGPKLSCDGRGIGPPIDFEVLVDEDNKLGDGGQDEKMGGGKKVSPVFPDLTEVQMAELRDFYDALNQKAHQDAQDHESYIPMQWGSGDAERVHTTAPAVRL